MKRYLKIAINFIASLCVMVSGTMQAAQADEVWLDFSVPKPDVRSTAPIAIKDDEAAATASISQPRLYPSVKASENPAKLIALDFSVPNAGSTSAPVAAGFPARTEPSNLDLTPPPVKAQVSPPPKPSFQPPTNSAIETPTTKQLSAKTRSNQLTALRRAIVGQESAGKFWLVNPDSGALGYGQLLKANVAPWTKAALGRSLTPEEFLRHPDLQIKTIDHKLNKYLQRELAYTGGNEELAIRRVASAWYSGNPRLWNNTSPQYSNGRRYPSIESYTRSVWKRYLREIG